MKPPVSEIVIINQDSGYLTIDIANAYQSKGYTVTLITGRLVQRDKPLNQLIRVRHIVEYNRTSTFRRLITWSIGFIQIWLKLILHHRKARLLIVSNPPFATLLPVFVRNEFSLLVFDIFPDSLYESKILKESSLVVRYWQKLNQRVFLKAQKIYTLTDSMKLVLSKYTSVDKIDVVPLWTDNTFLKPLRKTDNYFIKENNLENKFNVLYSGNLGRTHNVELIVEIAALVKNKDITFVVIGEGESKDSMKKRAFSLGLKNILFLPWQTTETLPFSIATADVAIVSQAESSSNTSIPSKFYNFLSVGSPVLGISSRDSELNKLIKNHQVGECYCGSELIEMANFLDDISINPDLHKRFKDNSLKASVLFTSENALEFVS